MFDGTMTWAPFVEQTISMVRDHQHNYRLGPGYHKDDSGNIIERCALVCCAHNCLGVWRLGHWASGLCCSVCLVAQSLLLGKAPCLPAKPGLRALPEAACALPQQGLCASKLSPDLCCMRAGTGNSRRTARGRSSPTASSSSASHVMLALRCALAAQLWLFRLCCRALAAQALLWHAV